jgi:hypothetical protein
LDDSNAEVSAQVAHGLAFAACLPEDMKQWAGTQSGPVFRHITRGLMMVMDFLMYLYIFMCCFIYSFYNILNLSSFFFTYVFFLLQATQGVLSMEARVFRLTEKLQKKDAEHEKSMSEVLESAANNYKKLEDEHFKNINIMKEAEERARTEEAKRAQMEAEITEMREKMKNSSPSAFSRSEKLIKREWKREWQRGRNWGRKEPWTKSKPSSRWYTTVGSGMGGSLL